MLVSAISKEEIYQISLPEKVKGQYWLYTGSVSKEKLVSIEGINDEWVLQSNSQYQILDEKNRPVKSVLLAEMKLIVVINEKKEKTFIFPEPLTEDRQIFNKYVFSSNEKLSIGRSTDNDIAFNSKVVSSHHCEILYSNNRWKVDDVGSANGTFVNGRRVKNASLKFGDVVLIMGLKIVLGKNFIAINNPDNRVKISSKLQKYISQPIDKTSEEQEYKIERRYFYRSPRFKRDIETLNIKIDAPPDSPIANEMPMVLVLGTSLTMGMMSIVTLANAVMNDNYMSMAMGGSMLLGTVLVPVVTKKYERNRNYKKEKLRQKKYQEYLDSVSVKIDEATQLQKEILNENLLSINECEKKILETRRTLWDRNYANDDFLQVRIGTGDKLLDCKITAPEKKFELESDNLTEQLNILSEYDKYVKDVPISYSLLDNSFSGVIGSIEDNIDFAKGIIIQLASMYSYDEVKFVFIYDKNDYKDLDFVKWLPHTWSNDNKFRFIATDINESKEVANYLDGIFESEEARPINDDQIEIPYYIVFSFSKGLSKKFDLYNTERNKRQVSVITFENELNMLPKECSTVVELKEGKGRLFNKNDTKGSAIDFIPNEKLNADPELLCKKLSNVYLDSVSDSFKLPSMITFLNLFGVGKIEHLNVRTRWKENDPTKSLAAAVGVDTSGDHFMLDIHEKFHGPHGLIAGMTGSGKSEFIISYILSLAINYHPNEVAFVLIDYKGGGMAKSFENLPHTVGIITNLDGAAINRSLVSIESELKRRQAIFAEASKKIKVSNIDIYRYQKLYRDGIVDEPLPHLFIISDEFAELKTQRPEFMTQLVSAARIGRSLGVHLILATQKPSGVVDDQIWSNSRFRVCLKVQERADSQDMLKRPDAAELSDTGRFYLQVGYNELFEIGQSAWSGAPYTPSDSVIVDKDESVQVIDTNANVIKETIYNSDKVELAKKGKQVDEITQYLCETAEEDGIIVRKLWLEPISPKILVDKIRTKYHIKPKSFVMDPVIGELDDPARQKQDVLKLPLSTEGNAIVYGSVGSGKTSFLNAMTYSLIHEHTPEEVNVYLMDFGAETLRSFIQAPHVGDVILSSEEEKINNLFKKLLEECARRKKLFADYGGDYQSYIKNSKEKLPSIVVAINNFAAFTENYEEKEDVVTYLSREGLRYGIYFVLTASSLNGVRFRLAQNFNQTYVLQLNDESDYSSIVGRTDGLFPSKYKGRGLVKLDSLYEFQVANIVNDQNVFDYIMKDCLKINKDYKGLTAPAVPVLPEVVNIDYLKPYFKDSNMLPIGVETESLNINYYPYTKQYINMILSNGEESALFLKDLFDLMSIKVHDKVFAFDTASIFETKDKNVTLCNTIKECNDCVNKLFDETLKRNNDYKKAQEKGKKPKEYEKILVYINSINSLQNTLSSDEQEKLLLILEKGRTEYNINIFISEQIGNVSSFSYEKWFKSNVSSFDGIWLGNGFVEQFQIKANNITKDMRANIPSDFGFSVVKGKCKKVKLLNENMEE